MMDYSYSRLIIAAIVGCAVLILAGVMQVRKKKPKHDILVLLRILALGIGIVGGLFTGTLISHGLDVPWYIFGAVIAIGGYVLSAIMVLVWPSQSGRAELPEQ